MENLEDDFNCLNIKLASPERIKKWAERLLPTGEIIGEVTAPETISHRTLRPRTNGLFCEKIFGPIKSWECKCGKQKRSKERGSVCKQCGVELIESRVRRHRMGYINLAAPVTHVWYLKGSTSYISTVLDFSEKHVEQVVYFNSYVVTQGKNCKLLKDKIFLNEQEWANLEKKISKNKTGIYDVKVGIGAEAIKELLEKINLELEVESLRTILPSTKGTTPRNKIIKRLRILSNFVATQSKPSWMILTVLPVIPPDLRPMVQLDGGRFAASDLNDLYLRIINRNIRLQKLGKTTAPEVIIMNEKRMLQESVDALIANGKRGKAVVGANNRPLKSLSEVIEGKQGRFRQNLLGKRVDYSGRSVIIIGPKLKLNQCGLPKEMALELFRPFVIHKLIVQGIAQNIKTAKRLLQEKDMAIWDVLRGIIYNHPILLNRAPTLHRLGIQAFEPTLIEGRAIKLHPLVCPAFNADFDGDQMAVHVPLTTEAQTEARVLMMAPLNFLSPATGEPIMTPGQDVVLGCYYLTSEDTSGNYPPTHYFSCQDDCLKAYEQKILRLHSQIWVRMNGPVEDDSSALTLRASNDKYEWWASDKKIIKKSIKGQIETQYVLTTPGRILLHKTICDSITCFL
ncbi:RNA polymerase beta' subunit (plastid) [Cryptomonas paramecium]|uniref:DNA-directed RNA polymerase subunit gamma n=1 Tax=Cryptomonas paramaecium TaxID=2898 RepID=D2IS79_9CRYP|nr:RNA polymerase beta' subunit [Cryptomonas paramecium]ACT46771.1 RNA polymerase beta' subunit [Cryptomonas paramecium]BDA98024.1 RNA polymerase beta' subunit [Cryptomonas paramecium]